MTRRSEKPAGLPVITYRAACIDIGARFHVAVVPPDLCGEPVQTLHRCESPELHLSFGESCSNKPSHFSLQADDYKPQPLPDANQLILIGF